MSSHGGKRNGSGRKTSTGSYGEATEVIRIPPSAKSAIVSYLAAVKNTKKQLVASPIPALLIPASHPSRVLLNLYSTKIAAGLPSPADDYVEDQIDINSFLIQQKGDSFITSVSSDSLKDLGIVRNHYVVINRDLQAKQGDVIAAIVDGGFTLKILSRTKDGRPLLKKANPDPQYKDIEIKDGMQFEIWGVVTGGFVKF